MATVEERLDKIEKLICDLSNTMASLIETLANHPREGSRINLKRNEIEAIKTEITANKEAITKEAITKG
jgi:DNA repair ATPase RecN